jgi:hypothetical protein
MAVPSSPSVRWSPGDPIALTEAARIDPAELLRRHQSGDWGDFDAQDRRQNHYAVGHRPRIFSSYGKPPNRSG